MKVVHVANNDMSGGASRATFRLHEAMNRHGINSTLLVLHKYGADLQTISPFTFFNHLFLSFYVRIERMMLVKYNVKGTFSIARFGFDVSKLSCLKEADIIFLHWINECMLSVKDIERILLLGKPVYFYMHDMWALTGGCHHSFECTKYERHCGECQLLGSKMKNDLSFILHEKKYAMWNKGDIAVITPSRWLGECARRSVLFRNKSVSVIPNLLDTDIFKPIDGGLAREKLGLPMDKKLILFVAIAGVENVYKGWGYLTNSLNLIDQNQAEVVVVGSGYDENVVSSLSMHVHFLGKITSDELMTYVYSSADVFVSPSLADNFPNTIAESMACGTPVVGFNVGGIPDMIIHKYNGYLAQLKSVDDLACGINWVLKEDKINLSVHARSYAVNNLSYNMFGKYYSCL